jgi:hypothetical protein
MTHRNDIPLCETFDDFWDSEEVSDLIETTPLVFDIDGMPVGYDVSQLFAQEGAAHLGGRRF